MTKENLTLNRRSRKGLLGFAGLLVVAAAVAAYSGFANGASASAVQGSAYPPAVAWANSFAPPAKIAVNQYLTTSPFFTPFRVGVKDAAGTLGINVKLTGTTGFDTPAQISQFRALVREGYKAIIVVEGDPDAWNAPIKDAIKKGVLVITANTDAPKSGREAFFGQDLFAGGVLQGNLINKYTSGKKGTVLVTNCAPGADAITKRNGGSKSTLKKLGYTILPELATNDADPAKNRAALENALRANPDIVAISAACGADTAEAGALKQRKNGKFVVVGHDLLAQTLDLVKAGEINATIGQNPYLQSYLPIMYAYQRLVLGLPKTELPKGNWFTGTEVVTKANVGPVIKREARFK